MRLAHGFSLLSASVCVFSKALPGTRTNDLAKRDEAMHRQIQSRQMKAEKVRLRQSALAARNRRKTKAGLGGLRGRFDFDSTDGCPA